MSGLKGTLENLKDYMESIKEGPVKLVSKFPQRKFTDLKIESDLILDQADLSDTDFSKSFFNETSVNNVNWLRTVLSEATFFKVKSLDPCRLAEAEGLDKLEAVGDYNTVVVVNAALKIRLEREWLQDKKNVLTGVKGNIKAESGGIVHATAARTYINVSLTLNGFRRKEVIKLLKEINRYKVAISELEFKEELVSREPIGNERSSGVLKERRGTGPPILPRGFNREESVNGFHSNSNLNVEEMKMSGSNNELKAGEQKNNVAQAKIEQKGNNKGVVKEPFTAPPGRWFTGTYTLRKKKDSGLTGLNIVARQGERTLSVQKLNEREAKGQLKAEFLQYAAGVTIGGDSKAKGVSSLEEKLSQYTFFIEAAYEPKTNMVGKVTIPVDIDLEIDFDLTDPEETLEAVNNYIVAVNGNMEVQKNARAVAESCLATVDLRVPFPERKLVMEGVFKTLHEKNNRLIAVRGKLVVAEGGEGSALAAGVILNTPESIYGYLHKEAERAKREEIELAGKIKEAAEASVYKQIGLKIITPEAARPIFKGIAEKHEERLGEADKRFTNSQGAAERDRASLEQRLQRTVESSDARSKTPPAIASVFNPASSDSLVPQHPLSQSEEKQVMRIEEEQKELSLGEVRVEKKGNRIVLIASSEEAIEAVLEGMEKQLNLKKYRDYKTTQDQVCIVELTEKKEGVLGPIESFLQTIKANKVSKEGCKTQLAFDSEAEAQEATSKLECELRRLKIEKRTYNMDREPVVTVELTPKPGKNLDQVSQEAVTNIFKKKPVSVIVS